MSLFVIGDTHLSLSVNKPMDIFGGWKNYMQRLEENWPSKLYKGVETVDIVYKKANGYELILSL